MLLVKAEVFITIAQGVFEVPERDGSERDLAREVFEIEERSS